MPRLSQLLGGSELGRVSVRIMTAEALVRAGRRQQAAAHLHPGDLERLIRYGDVSTFAPLANVALALSRPDVADAALAVLDARPRAFASGGMTTMCAGEPVFHIRGILHRAAGRLEQAEHCHQLALEQARQAGALPFAAWVALDHATLLRERRGDDGGEAARELARLALAEATRLGAEGLARRARSALPDPVRASQASSPAPTSDTRPSAPAALGITRDGESWLVREGEIELRLSDSKGLKWLAQLVNEPGRELHVLDLSAAPGALDAGDAGELLDERARQQYRERLGSLEAELAEAEDHHDAGRTSALREELTFLKQELARALGLGGRERRAGAAAERARINVQRRLRDALRRITLQHPELGQRLERAIKTGVYCSYRP